MSLNINNQVTAKWASVIDDKEHAPIKDSFRKGVTAVVLENTLQSGRTDPTAANVTSVLGSYETIAKLNEATVAAGTGGFTGAATASGPVAGYDPILYSMIRGAVPNLIAYDLVGVQPMTGPTGLVFAMRSNYVGQNGAEAFYNEANTAYSGTGTHAGELGKATPAITTGTGLLTGAGELLGTGGANPAIPEMGFSIEKVTVEAKTRALAASYTTELAQDLKNVQGLDAEVELVRILSGEMVADINREVIRTLYTTAVAGSQKTTTPGTFDLDADANGRWSVEKYKGLMVQIDFESNEIAKQTRRGRGNVVLCSSDVASALIMAGVLDFAPAIAGNSAMNVDDTGNTFAGVLNGRYRVYIDPYAGDNYLVVGYKGSSAMDAGIFYCPYIPMQMARAIGENSFIPRIGFRTRYGMASNPFAGGASRLNGALTANTNVYYRRTLIQNLL